MDSTLNNPVVVGALVAAVYALVEALKYRHGRKQGNHSFAERDRQMLTSLHEQHSKTDRDGIPLWYLPRSMINGQDKLFERQGEMVELQRETLIELKTMNNIFSQWACPISRQSTRDGN